MLKNKAIILIHKDRLEYYDEIQSKIFQFLFQPTVFQDLELVDNEQLNTQLKSFISTNKLSPAAIIFLISDSVIFEKLFAGIIPANRDQETQKYLDNIPFEHVGYKIIETPPNFKVLAVNEELYTSIIAILSSVGFDTIGVMPQSGLGQPYGSSPNLTSDLIKYTISHPELMSKHNFHEEEIKHESQSSSGQNQSTETTSSKRHINLLSKYRLHALVSVFVLLIGVLGYVVYAQYTPSSNANPVPQTIVAPTQVPLLSPTQEVTPISSPSATPS